MEKVKFENKRDLELVGNYWEADSDTGIVMSHGYTGDKTEWGYFDKIAEELNEAGYNVLAFDFAGSGESDDEALKIKNQVEDLETAIDYIKSREIERVGLFGHSQGGLVSLRNYSDDIEAMVLTSPVTDSMANYADYRLTESQRKELETEGQWTKYREKGPRTKIVIDKEILEEKESVDQDELLENVECPVRIIHGNKDEVVSLSSSETTIEKLDNSDLTVIDGLSHDYDSNLDKVSDSTIEWFEKYLPV